jgi:hypothetical protein
MDYIPHNDITIPHNDITIPHNDITIPHNDKSENRLFRNVIKCIENEIQKYLILQVFTPLSQYILESSLIYSCKSFWVSFVGNSLRTLHTWIVQYLYIIFFACFGILPVSVGKQTTRFSSGILSVFLSIQFIFILKNSPSPCR